MAELYYDDSKDLYEGLITEEDDSGQQIQIAQVFPQGREYGHKFAAAPEMEMALKTLIHKFRVAGEMLGLDESHLLSALEQAEKALSKARR